MKTSHVGARRGLRLVRDAAAATAQVAYFGTGDEGKIFAVDAKRRAPATSSPRARSPTSTPRGSRRWRCATTARWWRARRPGGRCLHRRSQERRRARAGRRWPPTTSGAWRYDGKTGVIYAGTGSPGKMFAIDDKGNARELWDSGDKHVVSLAQDRRARAAAGRHVRGGDPVPRSAWTGTPRRCRTSRPRRCAPSRRARDAIYVAVNDFEKSRPRRGARAGGRQGHAHHRRRRPARRRRRAALPRPGPAQGQGGPVPPRARRAHRAGLLARRRLPDRGAARCRRRRPRAAWRDGEPRAAACTCHRYSGQGLPRVQGPHGGAGARPARAPGADAGARRHRRSWPAPATWAASTARSRRPASEATLSVARCSTLSPGALGHAALARARTA